ncbi:MAG: polysaccharide biosynthesis protein [Gammaproteobacteria bacterium]|nr:MAG: polysaccharide biosynthesis protein [Gammaproteobacteria bacterium]
MVCADTVAILFAAWGAFALASNQLLPELLLANLYLLPLVVVGSLGALGLVGLYRSVVRYMGLPTLVTVLKGAAFAAVVFALTVLAVRIDGVPAATFVLFPVLLTAALGSLRLVARLWLATNGRGHLKPVLIYGAGMSGIQLAGMLEHGEECRAVGFLDDDPARWQTEIRGLSVYPSGEMPKLVRKFGVKSVLLAMPSASRQRRREIVESLEALPVHVMTVPALADIVSGVCKVDELREVEIDDLLGREPVPPDASLLDRCIHDCVVMVTGAGGSIGGELCRQILARAPKRLVLLEQNEYGLYCIERELRTRMASIGVDVELIPALGSVLDAQRVQNLMRTYGVQTVYHAAAYKHVPLVEDNPVEGVRTNAFGTLRVVRAAQAAGVSTFVLISTDKAVHPTSVMGASKRVAELVVQALAAECQGCMRMSMVRFGNVLDSSGSVVPLFREQIRSGGPVTVTDRAIIRYFMTIPEAAQLVLQAGALGADGDVFVLDMGKPVRIYDLARRMIHLSGLTVCDEDNPDGDVEIVFTGLRPGEKLYEELLIDGNVTPAGHPMIMRAKEQCLDWPVLDKRLKILEEKCLANDHEGIRRQLTTLVDGYLGDVPVPELEAMEEGLAPARRL